MGHSLDWDGRVILSCIAEGKSMVAISYLADNEDYFQVSFVRC
jgi:hypothetical protein